METSLFLNINRLRQSSLLMQRMALVLGIACFTGLMAQIKIGLFFTPIPITGQTFAVLLSSVLLGASAGIGQIVYVILGLVGVPWFSNAQSGFGATFGYILGFVLASFFISYFISKEKSFLRIILIIGLANFIFIHGTGLLWLWFWLKIPFYKVFMLGSAPFILGDVIKIILVALIAKDYNNSIDKQVKISDEYINNV